MKLNVNCKYFELSDLSNIVNIKLFYANTGKIENKSNQLYQYLSEEEKEKAENFKSESDRVNFVASHALLRQNLSAFLGVAPQNIEIKKTKTGKPFLSSKESLSFNLSKTKDRFAFIVGHGNFNLGVDIENIRTDLDYLTISRQFFNKSEYQSIYSLKNKTDGVRLFYELWTRKEALLKAIGIGINTNLKDVVVMAGSNKIELDKVRPKSNSFCVKTTFYDSSVLSIASSSDFSVCFSDISLEMSGRI